MFNFISNSVSSIKQGSYSLKSHIIEVMKLISFVLLIWVSFNLSLDLYKDFGGNSKDASLFVMLVIGLELSKVSSLVFSKTNFYLIQKDIKSNYDKALKGIGFFFLYMVLALVSIFASYGFVRTSIDYTVNKNVITKNTDEIDLYEKKVKELTTKIDGYLPQLARDNLSIATKQKYEEMIATAEKERSSAQEILSSYKVNALSSGKQTTNMYSLIAKDMGVTEEKVRFWVQIITVVVVEICLAVMAPGIHSVSVEKVRPLSVPTDKIEEVVEKLNTIIPEPKKRKYVQRKSTSEYKKRGRKPKLNVTQASSDMVTEAPMVETPITMNNEVSEVTIDTKLPTKETAFEKFIHALFNNGSNTSLKSKLLASEEAHVPLYKTNEFFTALSSTKGHTGYPLIEFRPDGNWYPNYTDQYIIDMYINGKILNENKE